MDSSARSQESSAKTDLNTLRSLVAIRCSIRMTKGRQTTSKVEIDVQEGIVEHVRASHLERIA